jgi:hypothetical protein
MEIKVRKRWAVVAAVAVLTVTGMGVAYAASPPSDSDADQAVQTLQAYIDAHRGPAPTVTVTVTATPSASPSSSTPSVTSSVTPSSSSPSTTPAAGPSCAPTGTWAWSDCPTLGTTPSGDQWASATVTGLTDADHNAAFRLRNTGSAGILVAISGTQYKIEQAGQTDVVGAFTPGSSGVFRAEISAGNVVTLRYNGAVIATSNRTAAPSALGITPSVWQSTATVKLANIMSNVGPASSPTPSVTPSVTPSSSTPSVTPSVTPSSSSPSTTPAAGAKWISGAASSYSADGSFGTWRGEPVGIGGTWDDSFEEQTAQDSLVNGDWKNWNGPIDEAVGAIWKDHGESWSAAASGAYNARWTTALQHLATNRAGKGTTYIRFAHEMNGDWTQWSVKTAAEATSFKAAITQFSNLRYQFFPAGKIVMCPNDGTTGGQVSPKTYFPDKDSQNRNVVDVFCADYYNQYPHITDYNQIRAHFLDSGDGIEMWRQFAESKGVPFALGEWGNCGIVADCAGNDDGLGEAPNFMNAVNDWAREHAGNTASPVAGQLLYEVHFNLWPRFAIYGAEAHQPATATRYQSLVWGQ